MSATEPKPRKKPAPAVDGPLLNHHQACRLLGVSRAALIRTMRGDKTFPAGAKLGRNRLWLKTDLISWVSAQSKRN